MIELWKKRKEKRVKRRRKFESRSTTARGWTRKLVFFGELNALSLLRNFRFLLKLWKVDRDSSRQVIDSVGLPLSTTDLLPNW